MKIVTAPSRHTLQNLGLEPEAGLNGGDGADRRGSMLAWHLNRWVLAQTGGSGERPWLGNPAGVSGHRLAEFRHRLQEFDRVLGEFGGDDPPTIFGWEFCLTAGLWRSSSGNLSGILLVHSGFEEECRRLAGETQLPVRLAEPLLRSWLLMLYRCASGCKVILHSLPEGETPASAALTGQLAAEDLTESGMTAADPLPDGTWRLRRGRWDVAATADDFAVAGALQQLGRPPADEDDPALALGRDRVRRGLPVSPRTYRDARNVELRGLERLGRERTRRREEREAVKELERSRLYGKFSDGRPSVQIGRYFRYLLKRIFSRKHSR